MEIEIVVTGPLYEKSGIRVTMIFPIILMFSDISVKCKAFKLLIKTKSKI